MGIEVLFGVMKMCWNWVEVTVTQHCERTKCHRIPCFKTVNFMLCEFHFNFFKKNNSFQTSG